MSTSVAHRRSRTTLVISLALCIILLPLTQAALGYLSARSQSPWYWLAGTPISYFFICGVAAFCVAGGVAPIQARKRSVQIGAFASIGGAVMTALIATLLIAWSLNDSRLHPMPSRLPGPGLALFVLFFWFVPLFLGTNLLGIALGVLGGMFGGFLRTQMGQGSQPVREQPGEQEPTWRVMALAVVIVTALLAILMGVAFIVLVLGAFP